MGYKREHSPWGPLYGQLDIKRRALECPTCTSANEQGRLNCLDKTLFLLPSKDAQKPSSWTLAFVDEVTLDNQSDGDPNTSDSLDSLESRRSNSLESLSDRVFSSSSSRSASSSRSSSRTRMSATNDSPNIHPREPDCTTTQAPRIPQSDWPTSISSIDQPLTTTACLWVFNGAGRVPLTTINGNHSKCSSFSTIKAQSDDDNMDRSSTTTPVSNSRSLPDESSVTETDGNSTEGDGSTNSRPSSHVSDAGARYGSKKACHDDKLEALIKDNVLRTDPDVADLFYQAVKDELEYSEPECHDRLEDIHEFSLLDLLELEAFNLVQHSGANTERAASPTKNSPASSAAQPGKSLSAAEQGSGSGSSHSTRNASLPQDDPNQLVKTAVKPSSSQHSKPQQLRCIHNAIAPGTFSVNPETLEKFRTCSGPGWNSIQHLKEHMQNVHTKQIKRVNPLQCSRCQDDFSNPDDLKSHELNVDCAIRCPNCSDEFMTKALRQEHQRDTHPEEAHDPVLRELDDNTWKTVKENLKIYTDYVKNKRGSTSGDPDPERTRWVLANTPRYESGRSKTKVNSKLELGQWYTIFTTLAPNTKILEHPFYDYGTPRSDYAEERILFIHEEMIAARVKAHGMPPSNFNSQREWYREALRDSLRVAAQTKKVSKINEKSSQRRSNTFALSPDSGSSTVGGSGYNVAIATTPQVPQAPIMDSNVPNMHLLQPNYQSDRQQQVLQNHWGMGTNIQDEMTIGAINYLYDSPSTMTDNNGQQFPPNFAFLDQSSQNNFDHLGDNNTYSDWQGHQGGT